jgi:hypothetical protein
MLAMRWPALFVILFSSACAAAEACAATSTKAIHLTQPRFRRNGATKRYHRTVIPRNISAEPIPGPISLVLDNLSEVAKLFNSSGETACAAPLHGPFVNVDMVGRSLLPGATATVMLEFTAPDPPFDTSPAIAYNPRVLSGVERR